MLDGDEENGATNDDVSFNFGDDDFLDLSFGETEADPADLNADDVAAGTEPVVTDLSGAKPATAPVTAPPPVTETAPATAPVTQPAGTQPPAPAGTQPPTEQPGATDQPTVNIEEFVAANADAIIDNLSKTHFAIDDATATALNFSPEVRDWVQKRDAKNFMLTMVQVNNALQRSLPSVVANLVELTQQTKTTQEGFFSEFADLKDHVKALNTLAPALKAANPNLDKKSFQTLLGNTARMVLGLPVPAAKPVTQQISGRNVRRGQARPFTPAGASQPQRNLGGNGEAAADPLAFMNAQLRLGADD
jgi:hypothetical protein